MICWAKSKEPSCFSVRFFCFKGRLSPPSSTPNRLAFVSFGHPFQVFFDYMRKKVVEMGDHPKLLAFARMRQRLPSLRIRAKVEIELLSRTRPWLGRLKRGCDSLRSSCGRLHQRFSEEMDKQVVEILKEQRKQGRENVSCTSRPHSCCSV